MSRARKGLNNADLSLGRLSPSGYRSATDDGKPFRLGTVFAGCDKPVRTERKTMNITRRAAFGGFATLPFLAVPPALAPAPEAPREDPTLLRLGEEMGKAADAADAAAAEKIVANARFMAMAPLPDELVAERNPALRVARVEFGERDGFYELVPLREGEAHKVIYTAYELELAAKRFPETHLYPGDHIRHLLEVAYAHEDVREKASHAAGIYTVLRAASDAHAEVRRLSDAIGACRAYTVHGIAIKASAFLAVLKVRQRESRLLPDPIVLDLLNAILEMDRQA